MTDTSNRRSHQAAPSPITASFEFFPPKSDKMAETLWNTVQRLAPLAPSFVSVTYGAGGSTRERTHKTVERILKETDLAPAAHLTCVGASQDEVNEIVRDYWDLGVRHLVALRGDPLEGIGTRYTPHDNGYPYASDLVAGIKKIANFDISVSGLSGKTPGKRVLADGNRQSEAQGGRRVLTGSSRSTSSTTICSTPISTGSRPPASTFR